jgi:hypothetical protein
MQGLILRSLLLLCSVAHGGLLAQPAFFRKDILVGERPLWLRPAQSPQKQKARLPRVREAGSCDYYRF